MKKKHWLTSLLLSSSLLLAACASDGGSGNTGTDDIGTSDGDTEEVTTLTFFSADLATDDPFTNPVAQEITKRTGIQLEITHPVGGDEQAVPLMIASGDYPDMIFGKGDINKLIDAGAVIPLDDLIEEKGENIKAMYGDQLDRLRNSLDDPQIYHLGTGGVENRYLTTSGTFQIQFDVLKELGYPEIRTLEEYEEAIKSYVETYPEIDGQSTIGLSLLGSDWRWLITVGNPAGFAAGLQDDGQWHVDEETGDTVYKFLLPEFKEYFKWLNHMNDIGLLDPESFTQTYDTYIAKLSSGRVLGTADQDWDVQEAVAVLKQDEKDNRLWAPLPVTLGEEYISQSTRDYGFTGATGISISSTSEKQEEAFEFLDWMASEEAQILVNWGVEGEHYEVVDGLRVQTDEDRKNNQTNPNYGIEAGIGAYIYPFPQWGNGAVDSNGQSISRDTKEDIMVNYTEAEKETLAAYGVDLWVETFPATETLGIPAHGRAYEYVLPSNSDVAIIQQKADDFTTQKITEAILANPANFDSIWDGMITELENMGIKDAEVEMTELTHKRLELWGNN
ncbi:ABC transporter substrate-binding protein [Jeotgalibaca ciconiae]|uniref:Extracellular solute-binding protein n=1 Tax=Jeotgalibaca ciconiae TaxID=2496265 RepID=A0A3Q9BL79_9LACT|nr:ABC transporter substrate-binding protein [Jeotgalibaca ciconiae]AZP04528.1 extracellular solute-binding protein [Jeotgalibaca ciconiae]